MQIEISRLYLNDLHFQYLPTKQILEKRKRKAWNCNLEIHETLMAENYGFKLSSLNISMACCLFDIRDTLWTKSIWPSGHHRMLVSMAEYEPLSLF